MNSGKMRFLTIFLFLSIFASLTVSFAQSNPNEMAVRQTVQLFYDSFNSHDWKKAVDFAAEDWNHINPQGGRTSGRENVLKELRQVHSTFLKGVTETIEGFDVSVASRDSAIATVTSQMSPFTLPDGSIHKNEKHIRTFVVVKRYGRWLIAQDQNTTILPNDPAVKTTFDAKLAEQLGADERGMKMYVLCILKTGPKDADIKGKERDETFAGHFANINRLAGEGKLAVAGPFEKNDKAYRGLYIFNVPTIEEAEKLVVLDPAVKAGVFVPDLTLWYGSAAMMVVSETHKKLTRTKQ